MPQTDFLRVSLQRRIAGVKTSDLRHSLNGADIALRKAGFPKRQYDFDDTPQGRADAEDQLSRMQTVAARFGLLVTLRQWSRITRNE